MSTRNLPLTESEWNSLRDALDLAVDRTAEDDSCEYGGTELGYTLHSLHVANLRRILRALDSERCVLCDAQQGEDRSELLALQAKSLSMVVGPCERCHEPSLLEGAVCSSPSDCSEAPDPDCPHGLCASCGGTGKGSAMECERCGEEWPEEDMGLDLDEDGNAIMVCCSAD